MPEQFRIPKEPATPRRGSWLRYGGRLLIGGGGSQERRSRSIEATAHAESDAPPCKAEVQRHMRHVFTYLFLCLGLTPGTPQASAISGQASVIDGDTLEIHGQRIRLHGIDALESPQYCYLPDGKTWRCGQMAALQLQDFIGSKTVTCEKKGKDRYRRVVAVCSAAEQDLGAWLVESGSAMAYELYSKAYVEHQKRAEAAQVGIWQSRFQKPWEWRLTYKERTLLISAGNCAINK